MKNANSSVPTGVFSRPLSLYGFFERPVAAGTRESVSWAGSSFLPVLDWELFLELCSGSKNGYAADSRTLPSVEFHVQAPAFASKSLAPLLKGLFSGSSSPTCLWLPGLRAEDDLAVLDMALAEAEEQAGQPQGRVGLIPVMDSRALRNAEPEMMNSSSRIHGVGLGGYEGFIPQGSGSDSENEKLRAADIAYLSALSLAEIPVIEICSSPPREHGNLAETLAGLANLAFSGFMAPADWLQRNRFASNS